MAPISLLVVTFTAIMYVDDTDLFVVGQSHQEIVESAFSRAENLVDIWCRSIWATGGLLRTDKCFWYLVGFEWTGSQWRYLTKADNSSSIAIPNIRGEQEQVKRHEVEVAEETLGVFVAVDGNLKEEKTN